MNKKLKLKIIEKFDSQFMFAQAVNEHESVVSKVVRTGKRLSPEKKKEWADKLNCKVSELFSECARSLI